MNSTRQIKIGTVLVYAKMISGAVINFVYIPILLSILGKTEYGIYSSCASIIGYLTILDFGFSGAYVRFFSKYSQSKDEGKIRKLNFMFLLIFVLIGLIICVCGALIAFNVEAILGNKLNDDEIALARILLMLMTVNMAITMPSSSFSAFIASREKFIYQRGMELLKTICNPFLTIPVLIMGKGSVGVVMVTTLLTIIVFVCNIIYTLKCIKIKFAFGKLEFGMFKEIFAFSFFVFLQMLMDQINWQIDKLILIRISGSIPVAFYSVGSQINSYYVLLAGTFSNSFIPRIHRLVEEKMYGEINDLFIKIGRLQFFISIYIFSTFLLFGKAFIRFWVGQGYSSSYYVAVLLMFPIVIALSENIGIEILRAENRHGLLNIIYCFNCLGNIIITIPLCMKYSEIGSALGTCISMFLGQVIIANIYYFKVGHIDVLRFFKQIVKITISLSLAFIIGIVLTIVCNTFIWYRFLLVFIIYTVIFAIMTYFIAMNGYEKNMINTLIAKCIKWR